MKYKNKPKLKGKEKRYKGWRCKCEWCIDGKNHKHAKRIFECEQQVEEYNKRGRDQSAR